MLHSRRAFLGLLAASAMAQVDPLPRRGPAQKIVILGGGLAGLCAAYELRSQGHTAMVLEAQLRPGGRVYTLRQPFAPGLYAEAGAEAIPQSHEITRHYANELNLTLLPNAIAGTRSFYHVGGRRIFPNNSAAWPFELTPEERQLGLAGLRKKYITAAVDEALAAGYAQQPVRAIKAWDAFTPGAWLRSSGASRGAAQLLALGFGTEFGSAASFLLHTLNTLGSTGTFRIQGGNDALPKELARRVEIRYGVSVVGVKQTDTGVEVAFRGPSGIERLKADRAVCALPCPVIGKIFDDARLSATKQRAIREQNYSHTVKFSCKHGRGFGSVAV